MAQKKYVSLSKLSTFLDNLKNKFALKSHNHTITDITDYTVDSELSSTSTNPVQNNVLNAEFEAVSTAMNALDSAIDGKADISHTHNYAGSSSAGGDAHNALKLQGYTRSNLYTDLPTWINAVGLSRTIIVEGDKDTYYPVQITLPRNREMPTYISIYKDLGSRTPDITGNHSNGTSSMWLIYEGRSTFWDGNGGYLKTLYKNMEYAQLCSHTIVDQGNSGDLIVWLRGGGCLYNIAQTNGADVPIIHYEETNIGNTPVAPMTELGNKGEYSTTYIAYGNIKGAADTATKAAQDGNGNVITDTYMKGYVSSPRNCPDGTLITTSIDYSVTNGDAFYLEIVADTYGDRKSIFTQAQGYIWEGSLINYGMTNHGYRIPELYAMNVDGLLCFWFPNIAYWQSFGCKVCRSSSSEYSNNLVTNVINAPKPDGTKVVALHDYQFNSLFSNETAAAATCDASGNTITSTYETKTDAIAKLNNVQTQLDNLQTTLDGKLNKTDSYTKTEIDNMEFITVNDIDAICDVNMEITFVIDNTTYSAIEGMTWEEWVNSAYNTGGFYINNTNIYIQYDEDYESTVGYYDILLGIVNSYDFIIANVTYKT